MPNPPSFYEADLEKWAGKFKDVVKARQEFKRKYLKDQKTTHLEIGGKLMEKVAQRRKSRLSNDAFNVVDFDVHGNTSSLQHLIKKRLSGPPTSVQLNFECRLRSYKSKTECKHKNQWINAYQNDYVKKNKPIRC